MQCSLFAPSILRIETQAKQELQLAEESEQLAKDARKFNRVAIDIELMRQQKNSLDQQITQIKEQIERAKRLLMPAIPSPQQIP